VYFLAHFCPLAFFRQMIALKFTLSSAEKADKNPFKDESSAIFFKTTAAALPEKTVSSENHSIWRF
jgi:hypothetical protein